MIEQKRDWPKVIVGRPCGYCVGVERAVEAYQNFVDTHEQGTVYSVGEPAHNPILVENFKNQGIVFTDDISEVPAGKNVVFGPHGQTKDDVTQAEATALEYLLTECPRVSGVKAEIAANTASGLTTFYFGQKDKDGNPHPETRAALSSGNAILVTSIEEALSPEIAAKITDPNKVAFCCQTTQNLGKVNEMAQTLKVIYPKIKMRPNTDLCPATTNRQLAAKGVIAAMAEKVVVVGDYKSSSNTRSLVEEVSRRGARVIVVNKSSELKAEDFLDTQVVGIIGSASAIPDQTNEVIGFFTDKGSELAEITVAVETSLSGPKPQARKGLVKN
jgi:4-hydroxy-3-methylbut-2-enyl diphosphate reductase